MTASLKKSLFPHRNNFLIFLDKDLKPVTSCSFTGVSKKRVTPGRMRRNATETDSARDPGSGR